MRSAPPLAALALAVTVLLTGCVPEAPDIDPPPEPTSEPVFASDEEALAAATVAYKAYLAMSDLIAQEGGKNPERIAPFVTEEWLEQELTGNKDLADAGRRLVGNFELAHTTLQQVFAGVDTPVTVVIYACLSPNGAHVVDASGADVTPEALKIPWAIEATFVANNATNQELLLSRNEPWSNDSSC